MSDEFLSLEQCPGCRGPLEHGELTSGSGLSWVPSTLPFRRTVARYQAPSRTFGRLRFPFWSTPARRCDNCDLIIASTRRGRGGNKRLK